MGLPINVTLGLDKLVETVANATGLTALGTIMNAHGEAKAQAYLAKKKAQTDTEVEILRLQGEEKVAQYVLGRNKQKVENVEDIVSKAKQQFAPDEQVPEEPVEKDWMNRFLNIAEEISDKDLQDIWGRILAGEIKNPKSYSLRTLEVLRNMSKDEALLLMKASTYQMAPDLISTEPFAVSFMDQISLDDIGVVCGDELIRTMTVPSSGKISFVLNRNAQINIYAQTGVKIKLKGLKLTKAGQEIFTLIQEHDYGNFYKDFANVIKKSGATKVTINEIVTWDGNQYQYKQIEREI